jgi:hypothetical protein
VTLSSTNLTVAGGPAYTVNLPTTAVTPGTYGSSSLAAQITVDANGRLTAATTNTLPTLSSTNLTVAGGPVYTVNLPTTAVTPGTYGSASYASQFTVDANGRITAASQNAMSVATTPTYYFFTSFTSSTTTGNQQYYWSFCTPQATPEYVYVLNPVPITITKLYVHITALPTGAGTRGIALYRNGAASATFTTTFTSGSGSLYAVVTGTESIAANDLFCLRYLSATPGTTAYIYATLAYTVP